MDFGYYVQHFLVGAAAGLALGVGFLTLVVATEKICYAIETYIKDNYP